MYWYGLYPMASHCASTVACRTAAGRSGSPSPSFPRSSRARQGPSALTAADLADNAAFECSAAGNVLFRCLLCSEQTAPADDLRRLHDWQDSTALTYDSFAVSSPPCMVVFGIIIVSMDWDFCDSGFATQTTVSYEHDYDTWLPPQSYL